MSKQSVDFNSAEFALVSGYLDGELTQQEAQKVELLIATDAHYAQLYAELSALRGEVQNLSLQQKELEHLEQLFAEPVAKTTRIFGLALVFIAALLLIGTTFYLIFSNPEISLLEKGLVGLLGAGCTALLISVLRQRLISIKTDKYRRVKL